MGGAAAPSPPGLRILSGRLDGQWRTFGDRSADIPKNAGFNPKSEIKMAGLA